MNSTVGAAGSGDTITGTGSAAIDVQDVGWTVGGAVILAEISLQVGKGELLAVIGPNGAGKSSLVNVISGSPGPAPDGSF